MNSFTDSKISPTDTLNIYVLELENNKYYVGRTKHQISRIKQHFSGYGSYWTMRYKPVRVVKVVENGDKFDEDKVTKQYMELYGIQNVRGGAYSQMTLSQEQINLVENEINHANDRCYVCKKSGHFGKDCDQKYVETSVKLLVEKDSCFVCKRQNHSTVQCYAKRDIYGNRIHTYNVCYRCGRADHWRITCSQDTDILGRKIETNVWVNVIQFFKSYFK